MKRFDMKWLFKKFHKTKIEKKSSKELEKALASADDDGFAILEKEEDGRREKINNGVQ